MRTTSIDILQSDYAMIKNWNDIYQWECVRMKGNTELLSEWLLNDFEKFNWSEKGLRNEGFFQNQHKGQCKLQTPIKQFTEKRFCYALFNSSLYPHFGEVIDYEIPLTATKQGKGKQSHGEIDFISKINKALYFFEAKKANSNESLLKAILEIFVYVFRLAKFNRLEIFRKEYKISDDFLSIPAVMIFKNSTPGKQLIKMKNYPILLKLISRINAEFNSVGISKLEFYMVTNFEHNLSEVLTENKGFIRFKVKPKFEKVVL